MAVFMKYPFAKTWWIDEGRVLGGCYPGTPDAGESQIRLAALIEMNVRVVINLQEPDERGHDGAAFPDYRGPLQRIADRAGVGIAVHRMPIRDWCAPSVDLMFQIQRLLRESTDAGLRTYVHCWGGHGRTGTVGGCWLIDQGLSVQQALATMERSRAHDPGCSGQSAPQSSEQHEFLNSWARRSHNP